jgi:hypothetical protein
MQAAEKKQVMVRSSVNAQDSGIFNVNLVLSIPLVVVM